LILPSILFSILLLSSVFDFVFCFVLYLFMGLPYLFLSCVSVLDPVLYFVLDSVLDFASSYVSVLRF
jgi:hypothetical protein